MHQFTIFQGRARGLVEGLTGVEDGVLESFLVYKTVDSELTIFWPSVGTSNISGERIDPKDRVCESRSGTELAIDIITRAWRSRYVGRMHIGALVGNEDC